MKTKIYGYYESVQILPQGEQFACANIWKQSWERNGWECVMLNRSHAQGSSLHQKLMAKLMKVSFAMPMEAQHFFPQIAARYSRWSALHAAGGGWMSDYDVVNIDFDSTYASRYESTLSMVCEQPCYLFFATREHCAASINKFIQEDFFADEKLRFECDILGIKDKWSDLADKVHHVQKSDKPKSELMASLL
jgi:hypothetical protein